MVRGLVGVGMVVVPRRRRGGEVGIGRYGCWCGWLID